MSHIQQYVRSFGVFLFFVRNIRKQRKFYARCVEPDIINLVSGANISESEKLLKKCSLYAVNIPARLGEAYCVLRGSEMSDKERDSLSCMGGLTGLFDDLFDENKLSDAEIAELLKTKKNKANSTGEFSLLIYLYSRLEKNIDDITRLASLIEQVFSAQIQSRRQQAENLSLEELDPIIAEKGGVSLLFYRIAFANVAFANERELIYQLGAIGQIVNDVFDVYEDTVSGIKTTINQSGDIKQFQAGFDEKVKQLVATVRNSGYAERNIQKFLRIVLLILSGAYLCMENYLQLQQTTEGVFRPERYTRKQLICDMEKPENIFRLIEISTQLNNKFIQT